MEAQQQQCGSSAVCGKPPPTPDTTSSSYLSKTLSSPASLLPSRGCFERKRVASSAAQIQQQLLSLPFSVCAVKGVSCRSLLIYCTAKLRSSTWTKTPETEFANASCEILAGAWSWEKCKKGKSEGDCIRRRRGGVDLAGIWWVQVFVKCWWKILGTLMTDYLGWIDISAAYDSLRPELFD